MYSYLYIGLILIPIQCNALFVGSSQGSLAGSWSLNASYFLREFQGGLLYAADYERNVLIMKVFQRSETANGLSLKFNKYEEKVTLDSLCGCDPCDDILVNFFMYTFEEAIKVWCNNHAYFSVSKVNNQDRINVDMIDVIKTATEKKNIINMIVLPSTQGCLYEFYHNRKLISFNEPKADFKSSCPRKCPTGVCNKGQCRLLDLSGPTCNCSTTALNGPHCDNSLKQYRREYKNNAFSIVDGINDIYLKLSWKRLTNKKYCLLQFVHGDGHETIWIYRSHLMKGSEILVDTYGDGINFITVTINGHTFQIKINNTIIYTKRMIMEQTIVYVGFSKEDRKCETFEGVYDFVLGESGFRQVIDLIPTSTTRVTSFDLSNIPQTEVNRTMGVNVLSFTYILVIGIVVSALIPIVCFSTVLVVLRRKRLANSKTENGRSYCSEFRKLDGNVYLHRDTYEFVDPDNVYYDSTNQYCSMDGVRPKLPPRQLNL